jgi:DNA helicase-2/ATP-dependent DNA helicase PcrA
LLLKATKLLKDNLEIRKIYQDRWQYVHIDEYQDTNEVQYLMSKLLSENNRNICVVGDADQNIYSWRGANLKNILNFEKDYPNAKIILLEQNYRSTKNILEAANTIIKKNKYRPDKNLFTDNVVGEKISLYEALDENDEADFVATKILEILDSITDSPLEGSLSSRAREALPLGPSACERPPERKSALLSDMAILYRANFQSRALEEAMLRYNIPYQVLGVKFFERREIKDTLAYLRASLNKNSLSDIKRIINFPARGIGKATLVKIFSGDIENLPIKMRVKINKFYELLDEIREQISILKTSEIIKFVVKKSGIENELESGGEEEAERLENIKELATLALKYDNLEGSLGIEKLLEDASLASDQDSLLIGENKKENINAIKLMTVHAAKGLEFNNVFVTGLEDGLFPHQRRNEEIDSDKEEERRLFYVALTRARNKLFLSFANFRTIFGSRQINAPSEFIGDIPADLLEKEGEKDRIKTIYI